MLVPLITAKNIEWKREDIELSKIILPWSDKILPKEYFPEEKITGDLIIERVKDQAVYEAVKKNSDHHAVYPVGDRDNYPIIVEAKGDKYIVKDGNRRTIRAIIEGNTVIDAWVANYTHGKMPENYWISTNFLRHLSVIGEIAKEKDLKIADNIITLANYLIANYETAKINFDNRIKEKFTIYNDLKTKE